MRNDQLVVIGGGPAGIFAIETIRQYDRESPIVLISDEPAYARMALPYYLAGEIPEARVLTGTQEHFSRRRVASIDPAKKSLALEGGGIVPWSRLLIATGSRPVTLDVPGAKGRGVTHLWTLDDSRAILGALGGKPADVLLVGAGFIGFIVLNALAKLGCRLSVVEAEAQILPRMLDSASADLALRWLENKGVRCATGVRVVEIGDRDGRKVVRLSDGKSLTADLVVVGIGVRPNIDLVRESGIRTNDGILVDDHLRTNLPDIYAAGDAAEGIDLSTGARAVHAIQPTAVEHGRVAGANMAGRDVRYGGSLSMNILEVLGLQIASLGLGRGDGLDATLVSDSDRPVYRKLVWDGDRIAGAIFLGPADDVALLNDVGMVKGLIQTKTSLGDWKRYLQRHPVDVRRPYVASQAPVKLLETTLIGATTGER